MNGNEIRKKREQLGLTQSELAALIGVSLRTIQNYEKDGVIPSSKSEILHNVLNTGNINIKGDGNVSNTGIVSGNIKAGKNDALFDLYVKGDFKGNIDDLTPEKMIESLILTIEKQKEEIEQLKKDKAILQEFVTFLQNKK